MVMYGIRSSRLKKNWQVSYYIDTNFAGCTWLKADKLIRSCYVEP